MDNPLPQGASAVEPLSPQELHWRAEREMADALSAFQTQVQPAAELTMQAVVEAAKPAFQRGFCFSVRSTDEGTSVVLMHRGGAQQSAESEAYDEDFQLSARLLAGLLGIPVGVSPRPSEAESERDSGVCIAAAATPAAAPAQADPADDPDHEPLSTDQISTLTAMLKEMARSDKEAWKRFTIAFRSHFEVPRTARTITDRITQRRHAAFIDRFERELGNAALPNATDMGPGSVATRGALSESEAI